MSCIGDDNWSCITASDRNVFTGAMMMGIVGPSNLVHAMETLKTSLMGS